MNRYLEFRGPNAAAFNSKEPEILIAGPAGSGKTACLLAKVLTVCGKYPGARVLICRKTRESLTETALVTWERDILGPDHPVLTRNPTLRRVRQSYRFENGSTVVVAGLDKPDKILSSEWDLIYAPEATDLNIVDWETLGGRLRSGRVPWQQLAGDCNPTTPHSPLYKRQAAGLTRMYSSTHKDNPRYFDRARNDWTPAGRDYLARLERMTGARRKRFLEGLWVAAEGVVYAYDADRHLLPPGWGAPAHWRRVWGIDWGKTAPTALTVWAADDDGRMHLTREVYQTHLRPDVLGRRCKRWISEGLEPAPAAIVCDHDEERKAAFEAASGLRLQMADKRDRGQGIEAMQARFDEDRIFFARDTRDHTADPALVDAGRPTCLLEELVGYVWNPNMLADEPIDENDHALDSQRYSARWIDAHPKTVGPQYATDFSAPDLPDLPADTFS